MSLMIVTKMITLIIVLSLYAVNETHLHEKYIVAKKNTIGDFFYRYAQFSFNSQMLRNDLVNTA